MGLANSGFRLFLEWGIMGNNAVQVRPVNLRAQLEGRDLFICALFNDVFAVTLLDTTASSDCA